MLKNKIDKLLEAKRVPVRELLEYIDMSEGGYYNSLKNESMRATTLSKIAKFFDVPIGYFFGEVGNEKVIPNQKMIPEKFFNASDYLKEKDQALLEKDKLLMAKDMVLNERDKSLTERDKSLTERDRSLSAFAVSLMEKDKSLQQKDAKLMEMLKEILEARKGE